VTQKQQPLIESAQYENLNAHAATAAEISATVAAFLRFHRRRLLSPTSIKRETIEPKEAEE